MTPPRLVELRCPTCGAHHWKIDSDFRGANLAGGVERPYEQRKYSCPTCGWKGLGYNVLQKSPPEFYIQPHAMYPMSVEDFAHWFRIFRTQFPTDRRLRDLGVSWYPGEPRHECDDELNRVRKLDDAEGYRITITNTPPETHISVEISSDDGIAEVFVHPSFEVRWCSELEDHHLARIRSLLEAREHDIRERWNRLSALVSQYRTQWMAIVEGIKHE